MVGLPHLLGLAAIVAGVSGCVFLDLLLGVPPFDPDNPFPSFPVPSAEVTFTTGTATLVIDGETIVLAGLARAGTTDADYGTQVTWTDGEGWYLTYYGYEQSFLTESSYVSLDRVFDNQHWVIYDQYRCVTTTTQVDAGGVVGTAVCRGLQWSDYFGGYSILGLPSTIPGEPTFDADITFEAH